MAARGGVGPLEPDLGPGRQVSEATEVALLDTAGVIVATNAAWDDFCRSNGGDPARVGIGGRFVYGCESARP
jgi:hypothetical protein